MADNFRNVGGITLDTRVLDRIARTLNVSTDRVLHSIAFEVEGEVIKSMKGGGKPHRPSAPGTPPNIEFSGLVNSIQARRIEQGLYYVEDGVEYGLTHELGDKTRNIPKRPFMVPAVERVRKMVNEKWKGLIR